MRSGPPAAPAWRPARVALAVALAAAIAAAACRAPMPPGDGPTPAVEPVRGVGPAVVRVALQTAAADGTLDADAAWELRSPDGRTVLARAAGGQQHRVARRAGVLVVTPAGGGRPVAADGGAVLARAAAPGGTVRWNGRRYRGELLLSATSAGVRVVNRVGLEDYLRGVVPREVGSLAAGDRAAIEAQAVAARSYAHTRLAAAGTRGYDVTAGVAHQVYGGADAERPASDAAVAATAGVVLLYQGRMADAPYHSTCGGHTAAPGEVWAEGAGPPYLRGVADRDPRTGRAYCDLAPRFVWRRSFDRAALDASLARYLRALPAGRAGDGVARSVRVASRTASGRVAELAVRTGGGAATLRGAEIRSALRTVGGGILNSTYFTVDTAAVGADGQLARLTLRGSGNGHGVGMCQWGAVGRARAGSDYRAILAAYYPGTTLGQAGGRGDAAAR